MNYYQNIDENTPEPKPLDPEHFSKMSYESFRQRLVEELSRPKREQPTPWMITVGYRPEDKDMGRWRWEELTAKTGKG